MLLTKSQILLKFGITVLSSQKSTGFEKQVLIRLAHEKNSEKGLSLRRIEKNAEPPEIACPRLLVNSCSLPDENIQNQYFYLFEEDYITQ
jgi:hypothetical protein